MSLTTTVDALTRQTDRRGPTYPEAAPVTSATLSLKRAISVMDTPFHSVGPCRRRVSVRGSRHLTRGSLDDAKTHETVDLLVHRAWLAAYLGILHINIALTRKLRQTPETNEAKPATWYVQTLFLTVERMFDTMSA